MRRSALRCTVQLALLILSLAALPAVPVCLAQQDQRQQSQPPSTPPQEPQQPTKQQPPPSPPPNQDDSSQESSSKKELRPDDESTKKQTAHASKPAVLPPEQDPASDPFHPQQHIHEATSFINNNTID